MKTRFWLHLRDLAASIRTGIIRQGEIPTRKWVVAQGTVSGPDVLDREAADFLVHDDYRDLVFKADEDLFATSAVLTPPGPVAVDLDPILGEVHDPLDGDAGRGVGPPLIATVIGV